MQQDPKEACEGRTSAKFTHQTLGSFRRDQPIRGTRGFLEHLAASHLVERESIRPINHKPRSAGPGELKPAGPTEHKAEGPPAKKSSGASAASPRSSAPGLSGPSISSAAVRRYF